MHWKATEAIKAGALVKLYNLYRVYYGDAQSGSGTRYAEPVVGMYIETGWSAQFEFFKIAVLRDENGRGGFVQNYLTSDFSMVPLTDEEKKEYGTQEKEL